MSPQRATLAASIRSSGGERARLPFRQTGGQHFPHKLGGLALAARAERLRRDAAKSVIQQFCCAISAKRGRLE